MEQLVDKLKDSREQILRGSLTFVSETREAGQQFVHHTAEAGRSALERTRGAGGHLVASVRGEAEAWREFLRAQQEQLTHGIRQLVSPRAVEVRLLTTVHQGLAQIDNRVEGRLATYENAPTETGGDKRSRGKKSKGNGKSKPFPIRNYESLTAKDVVARLDGLREADLKAIRAHERRHKQRQTVLKATEQRLSN
ncbi:MAG: hypothetical protein ACOCXM_06740 [Myxococcota bacterium]